MASADSLQPIPASLDAGSTRQAGGPPRVIRATFMLMPVGSTSQRSVQVSGFTDIGLLTPLRRLYPLPVRQASILPAASFRFRLTTDTLAVQLTLPLAGCVEDFHLQVIFPATTAVPTAPVTALRAMPGAPNKRAKSPPGSGLSKTSSKIRLPSFRPNISLSWLSVRPQVRRSTGRPVLNHRSQVLPEVLTRLTMEKTIFQINIV